MLLKKGNIYRNVSVREAAALTAQGYTEVKETPKASEKPKPKAKG